MPQVVAATGAITGLKRCRAFLFGKAPQTARRAGLAIERQFRLLETAPDAGRPVAELPELREFVIPFGNSGYVALYRHDPSAYAAYVVAVRHQSEAGY